MQFVILYYVRIFCYSVELCYVQLERCARTDPTNETKTSRAAGLLGMKLENSNSVINLSLLNIKHDRFWFGY